MSESNTERYHINYTWIFLGILLIYIVIKDIVISFKPEVLIKDGLFVAAFALINLLKNYLINTGVKKLDYFYLRTRFVEIFLICFGFFYMHFSPWIAIFIFGSIVLNAILEGREKGLHTAEISLLFEFVFIIFLGGGLEKYQDILTFTFILIAGIAAWIVVSEVALEKLDICKKSDEEIEELKIKNEDTIKLIKGIDEK